MHTTVQRLVRPVPVTASRPSPTAQALIRQPPGRFKPLRTAATAAAAADSTSAAADKEAATTGAPDHRSMLLTAVRNPTGATHITLRGKPGPQQPWRQISIRPVMLKGTMHLQFSQYTQTQNIVKNYLPDAASNALVDLLQLTWGSATVAHNDQEIQMQITKKGKAIIQRTTPLSSTPTPQPGPINLLHDRSKDLPIPPTRPDPFLHQIGLQTEDGRVRAGMHAKFTQVNEFLKLLLHSGILNTPAASTTPPPATSEPAPTTSEPAPTTSEPAPTTSEPAPTTSEPTPTTSEPANPDPPSPTSGPRPLHILDAGCGSSLLTFCTYHFLANLRNTPTTVTGIDTNPALISRNAAHAARLSITPSATFHCTPILSYAPPPDHPTPDVVLALHACDTATDEALAIGIRNQARLIMSVPCCHKHLHRQLPARPPMEPLMRHGILKQRFADMLTDSFRALLLRVLGYSTDVVEFVSVEHTQRNVLIRAVRGEGRLPVGQFVEEYVALKEFWGVRPHLEELLAEELRAVDERLVA